MAKEPHISVTPEVSPVEKKKPKRSVKSRRDQPDNPPGATIQTHPAPEAADNSYPAPKTVPIINGESKEGYAWDRTVEENRQKEAARLETERLSRLPLPPPKAKTLPWPDFCDYWNSIRDLPVAPCVRLYVQRWLPVLLPVVEYDRFNNAKESHPSDLKILATDGPLSEDLILQLGGVGDYTFRLNDTRRPWEQGTVCQSQLETRRLWDTYPPIFDLKRLDYEDKKNQVFIKFARARGILPREDEQERETNDMANAAVADRALDQAAQERARADQIQRDQLDRARAEAEAAKAQTAKVEAEAAEAKRQAEELKTKVQPGTPAAELLSVVSSVATLANSLKPPADNSFKEFLALESQREQTRREREKEERDAARESARLERERADKLQAEVIAIRTAPPPVATAVTAPPTAVDILQQEVQKKQLLKQLYGNPAAEEEEKAGRMDKWVELAPVIAPIAGSLIQGIFQTIFAGLQAWQNIHYNDALSKTGAEPKAPAPMTNQPNQTAAPEHGKPIPPTTAPPQTQEQLEKQQQWNVIMAGVQQLAPHLVQSLDDGETGAEFAEFIIRRGPEKRTTYERIRHLAESIAPITGPVPGANDQEKFLAACRFVFEKIPALWQKIGTLPTMAQFLTDFYNYDEILAKAEEENQ